jgi:hypothetical protein
MSNSQDEENYIWVPISGRYLCFVGSPSPGIAFYERDKMTKILYVHKADSIGDQEPKTFHLHNVKPLPPSGITTSSDMMDIYERDAADIVECLVHGLPQGTRIRVIKKLFAFEVSNNGYFRGI